MNPITRRTRTAATRFDPRKHTDWCAGGHRCNLGEHRADPLTIDVPGLGRALLTRVRGRDGREHAEVTLTVALAADEPRARGQLLGLARDLTAVIERATGPASTGQRRAA
ncbi:hypothetical protein Drose_06970 [Dactylosporangium roseum]|uniref:Uncharacterized protein n=1 Tax=Dactylosporangium roseum TaxID=47989 RepID=A0ABY5Z7G4_9ACTN|nr:hypothetical protein [Dactylosporangium roseum]UWZ38004.1 hypothetical protein Drose_06970 [Dactylosporangium roseum]